VETHAVQTAISTDVACDV